MRLLLSVFLLINYATASEGLESFINTKLPPALQKIKLGMTTKVEVKKLINQTPKEKSNAYLYELSHLKYDTTIGFKKDKVDYILYKFPKGEITKEMLMKWLEEKNFKASNQEFSDHDHTHSIVVNKKNIRLSFYPDSNYSLKSVAVFSK